MAKSTHVGSLPFTNIKEAIEFNKKLDLPSLPTLPSISENEYMLQQIAGGIKNIKIENFKIVTNKLVLNDEFKIKFLALDDFISEFKNTTIKWQVVGPMTLLKSFAFQLSKKDQECLLSWYQKLILNFHLDLIKNFKQVYLILDEPLFDIKLRPELSASIKYFKQMNIEVGLHCCAKLKPTDLNGFNLDMLSIDCSLYSSEELIEFRAACNTIVAGMISSVTAESIKIPKGFIRSNDFISPTCGLAFSSQKTVKLIINKLSIL